MTALIPTNPQWNASLIRASIDKKADEIANEMANNEAALRNIFRDIHLLEIALRGCFGIPVPALTDSECQVDRFRFRHMETTVWNRGSAYIHIAIECADSPEIREVIKVYFTITSQSPFASNNYEVYQSTRPVWMLNSKENESIPAKVAQILVDLDLRHKQAYRKALGRVWEIFAIVAREVREEARRQERDAERLRQEAQERAEREAQQREYEAARAEYRRQEEERAATLAHLDAETQQAMNWISALVDDLKRGSELDQKQRHVLESIKFVMSVQTYAFEE